MVQLVEWLLINSGVSVSWPDSYWLALRASPDEATLFMVESGSGSGVKPELTMIRCVDLYVVIS